MLHVHLIKIKRFSRPFSWLSKGWLPLALLLAVGVTGCGGDRELAALVAVTPTAMAPTPRPTITPAPTHTSTATLEPTRPTATPSITPTATPIPLDQTLVFDHFQIRYPSSLVRNSSPRFNQPQGSMIPFASSAAPSTIYQGVPDLLVVDLALFNSRRRGQLTIVEYANEKGDIYDAFGVAEREALLKLRNRVGRQSDFATRTNQIPEAFIEYVSIPGGAVLRGVQYIAPLSGVDAVGQENLFYVAEGVIGEQFYIYLKYPVDLSSYPEGIPFNSEGLGARSAIQQILSDLETDDSELLSPRMHLLDEMIASLSPTDPPAVSSTSPAMPTVAASATPRPATPTTTPTATALPAPTTTTTTTAIPSVTQRPPGAIPTNEPDCAHFLVYTGDVTFADGSVLPPNTEFVKTWLVENRGTCHLSEVYTLNFFAETMKVIAKGPVPLILAGEEGQISVALQTPKEPGTYTMWWQLTPPNDGSVDFQESFGRLFIEIVVEE